VTEVLASSLLRIDIVLCETKIAQPITYYGIAETSLQGAGDTLGLRCFTDVST